VGRFVLMGLGRYLLLVWAGEFIGDDFSIALDTKNDRTYGGPLFASLLGLSCAMSSSLIFQFKAV
jgi:hypothetical protein